MAMREEDLDAAGDAEITKKVKSKKGKKVRTAEEKAEKQARARARRNVREREKSLALLYKPVDQWDDEELARGRPRAADGTFRGATPEWVNRAVHEEALKRFTEVSRGEQQATVPLALSTIRTILTNEDLDDRGKPVVPWGVKADVAKWSIEHLLGKPTQRHEMDISVKLQGILATVMVQADEQGALLPAMDVESWDADEDPDLDGESQG